MGLLDVPMVEVVGGDPSERGSGAALLYLIGQPVSGSTIVGIRPASSSSAYFLPSTKPPAPAPRTPAPRARPPATPAPPAAAAPAAPTELAPSFAANAPRPEVRP